MLSGRSKGNSFFKAFIANKLGGNSGVDSNGKDADGRSSDWRVWAQAGFLF